VLILVGFLAVVVNSGFFGKCQSAFKDGMRTLFIPAVRKECESSQYVVIPEQIYTSKARSQKVKK
jgi:hypothetical protein